MIDIAKDDLITFGDAAGRLRVTVQTVRLWRQRGLEAVRIGKRWFTTFAAIDAFAVRSDGLRDAESAARADAGHREAMKSLAGRGIKCPEPKRKKASA